ncbi:MAG: tetratricopeptide repeat protein [Chloroflexi bacterium]|uniref:tetratricopeptide repeat protein n=1 Tax=Candidatus Flexifilum breve TaxID=3140694 RepID=UPI003135BA32|nr:tetratricopeptide repeat protein [Chloroflexota bacterium]
MFIQAVVKCAEDARTYYPNNDFSELISEVFQELYYHMHTLGEWERISTYWRETAIPFARKGSNPVLLGRLLVQFATIEGNRSNFGSLEEIYTEATNLLKHSTDVKANQELATTLFQFGASLVDRGNFEQAVAILSSCIEVCDANSNHRIKAFTLIQLANIKVYLAQFDEAYRILRESLEIWEKIGERDGLAHTSLYALGKAYSLNKKYIEAKQALWESLEIKLRLNESKEAIANCSHRLGKVLVHLHEYEEATKHLNTALQLGRSLDDKECIANTYISLAIMERDLRHIDRAIAYLCDALDQIESVRVASLKLNISYLLLPLLFITFRWLTAIRITAKVPSYLKEQELGLADVIRIILKSVTGKLSLEG